MGIRPVILAAAVSAALSGAALAQVTTDTSALDALKKPTPQPRATARPTPNRRPAPVKPEAQTRSTPPADRPTAATATPRNTPTVPPKVPQTPPAILALPPPVQVPVAHPPPIPVVPVKDDATGAAAPIKGGVRITFGADSADFNPSTEAVLRDFARSKAGDASLPITIYAYAAGSPDDPSTPRRLSLQRALAARAVLLHEGIPSPRIYPRALGPAGGKVDPDRIDVIAGPDSPPGAGSG